MNAEILLEQFDRISEAPDAVSRFRQFILELAVRGRLSDRDPCDESASALLKRIGATKSNDQPFALPDSWAWVSIEEIANTRLGKMLDKGKNKGSLRRYLRNTNVRWFDFDLSDVLEMRFEDSELEEFGLRTGDVLICEGGEPGRAAVWDERERHIYFQKAIHRVRFIGGVVPRYFVFALRQSADNGRLKTYFTGVGIKHFTGRGLSSFIFPLPPWPEQHRILDKVDELMALCHRLEEAQKEREVRRNRFAVASRSYVEDSIGGDELRQKSGFFVNHLARMTTWPEHIKGLRQVFLSLAVRGHLVAQHPQDEPASNFLGRRQLILDADRAPWKLPAGWAWSSLKLIGETLGGGTPSKANPDFWIGLIPWVSPKDMKVDMISDAEDHISEEAIPQSAAKMIPSGSILLVVRGMILAHSFPTAINMVPVTINQDMKAIVPFRADIVRMLLLLTKGLKPEILRLVLRSTHGTCKLLTDDLFSLPIPIPPLSEQQRILGKVDQLMTLCDQLETQLGTARTERERLLEAVLHDALNSPEEVPIPLKEIAMR